jgi:hypothetical protein
MRNIGEIVAVYIDNKPSIYARIEDYEADVKPRWFKLKMLFLTFPPQEVTWILRETQIDGEPFTMNNIPVKLNTVNSYAEPSEKIKTKTQPYKKSSGKIISLAERARVLKDEK